MSISSLEGITITDSDIDEIELLFGDVTFDKPRRDIIKKLESFDVQAFPGSGKTTVLIAKLAILAKKWPHENKGICVLSHTNVARDEIEERLGRTDIGKKLLSYPHFIGTLHSFCDTYISIPWLRSNGYPISLIDADIVLEKRWKALSPGAKMYLTNHSGKNNAPEDMCESNQYPVAIDIGCSQTCNTYKNVKSVIEQSQKAGYFTFNEMLSITKYVLAECPTVNIAVQNRFPVLFIDEAQDTSDTQWDIISSVFADSSLSIKQAFGDANQAIFQSYNSQNRTYSFPSESNRMTIPNSHRFGAAIAKLADSLAISQKGLVGDSTTYVKNEKQHTVFLFDKEKTDMLLQAYAKHVLTCFSDEEINNNSKLGCYVVGMVHNKEAETPDSKHFPVGIKDYYANYDPRSVKANSKPTHLIDYFRIGLNTLESTQDYSYFVESVSYAIRLIIINNSTATISTTSKAFSGLLSLLPPDLQQRFRKAMLYIVKLPFTCREEWNEVIKTCKLILRHFFGITTFSPLQYEWTEPDNPVQEQDQRGAVSPKNTFTFRDNDLGRTVDIQLASIHSVKGRTHLSTMVVETHWYDPNIKSILPWLYNKPKKNPGQRIVTRMKCHYVALTRARGLICIALPKDSVTKSDIKLLSENGWNVIAL